MKIRETNAGLERQIRIQTWIIALVGLILVCADIVVLVRDGHV